MTAPGVLLTERDRGARGGYTRVAIVIHWLIAILLFFELGLGLRMQGTVGPAKFAVFQLHKSVGITILLLAILRLVWRLTHRPPPVAASGWEARLASAVHVLFYVLLLAIPISGWTIISSSRIVVPTLLYGVVPWPHLPGLAGLDAGAKAAVNGGARLTHLTLIIVAFAFILLHIAGALKHQWLDDDGEVARMLPGLRPRRRADARLVGALAALVLAAATAMVLLPLGPTRLAAAPPAATVPTVAAPAASPPLAAAPVEPGEPSTAVTGHPTGGTDVTAAAGTAALATAAKPAAVATWAIAPTSTLQFHTTWSGQAVDGGFHHFDGTIEFDPDQLDRSRVDIRIPVSSIYSGDDQRDSTLESGDWFSADGFPEAAFKATRFRARGTGRYVADGILTIKGISLPLTLPFTLTLVDDKATMRGSVSVDRLRYRVGEGDYASTTEIPALVQIDVTLEATRRK